MQLQLRKGLQRSDPPNPSLHRAPPRNVFDRATISGWRQLGASGGPLSRAAPVSSKNVGRRRVLSEWPRREVGR